MKTNQEYVRDAGRCPACNSASIEGSAFEVSGDTATQEVSCLDCDLSWFDIYQLTGYELIGD